MNINKQLYKEIFQGLQKQFIVESVSFDCGNHPNGHYDVAAMVEGKVLPPDQAFIVDCHALVYERPWKVRGQYIESPKYRLSFYLPDGATSKQVVSGLMSHYTTQKAAKADQ